MSVSHCLGVGQESNQFSINPSSLSGSLPNVTAWLANGHVTDPTAIVREVRTKGGSTFLAFAKNKQWDKQLYEDLVAESLIVLICDDMRLYDDTRVHSIS